MKQRTQGGNLGSKELFRLRHGTVGDLDVLVCQRRKMWEEMGVRSEATLDKGDIAYRRWAREQLKAGKLIAMLVESRAGKVVGGGCLWLQPVQPTPMWHGKAQPYLMSMYTQPGHRHKGVASLIVREILEWSRRNGFPWVVLHASRKGRGVYKSLGFKRLWEMAFSFTDERPVRTANQETLGTRM